MDAATAPGTVAQRFAARRRAWEEAQLSPLAARSYPAQRAVDEPDCALRTPLQRDRDRIVHCKAFRRLKHKTQVFVAPEGDHYRTRMTHTIEVTQIARTVARALALNEDLVEAIGMGHDLGHPPFGHIGEAVLDACLAERFGTGFRHYEHSLRVVDVLEPTPKRDEVARVAGLNLCASVRDGIVCHSGRAPLPATLEGAVVRIVDRVAYINHDIDDALRAGVLAESELPAAAIAVLGDDRLGADRRPRPRPRRDLRGGRRHRPGRGRRRRDDRAAGVHVRARLPRQRRAPRARAHRARHPHAVRALRVGPGAHPRRRRGARRRPRPARHRLRRRHDRPLRRAHVRGAQRAGVVRVC